MEQIRDAAESAQMALDRYVQTGSLEHLRDVRFWLRAVAYWSRQLEQA